MRASVIVVGIDGSPAADHALAWARAHAEGSGATVRAVMTWQLPIAVLATGRIDAEGPGARAAEAAARTALDAAMKRAEGGPGPVTTVLRPGDPAPALLADAEESDAGLIVVGTRGLGPVRRWMMGSVSQRIARDAGRPVAVVPVGAPVGSTGPVLVGVDGSAGSIAALRWAADATTGPIHALHVMEYPFGPDYAIEGLTFEDHESFGREVVERTVAEAIGDREGVTTQVVDGDARDALAQAASSLRASMIVVGARGGRGLAGIGSVATSVASHADVTVVVVPPA